MESCRGSVVGKDLVRPDYRLMGPRQGSYDTLFFVTVSVSSGVVVTRGTSSSERGRGGGGTVPGTEGDGRSHLGGPFRSEIPVEAGE